MPEQLSSHPGVVWVKMGFQGFRASTWRWPIFARSALADRARAPDPSHHPPTGPPATSRSTPGTPNHSSMSAQRRLVSSTPTPFVNQREDPKQ